MKNAIIVFFAIILSISTAKCQGSKSFEDTLVSCISNKLTEKNLLKVRYLVFLKEFEELLINDELLADNSKKSYEIFFKNFSNNLNKKEKETFKSIVSLSDNHGVFLDEYIDIEIILLKCPIISLEKIEKSDFHSEQISNLKNYEKIMAGGFKNKKTIIDLLNSTNKKRLESYSYKGPFLVFIYQLLFNKYFEDL